jgi:gas vesicle protein
MSNQKKEVVPLLVAFAAGAAIGAAAALLLTPISGREMRGKLADLGETSAGEVKRLAREARFRISPKSKSPDYTYDGGDAWI